LKRTKKYKKYFIKHLLLIMYFEMTTFEQMKLVKDAQNENVEEAPLEEPPPKPPEHIANEKVALDATLPLLVEGKTNGKTIAELMADYLSNNGKEQFDQLLECPISENKCPHTNSTLVHRVPFSSNDSYKIQTYDNCSEEALCLDNDFGNFGEELEMDLCMNIAMLLMGCMNPQWRRMRNGTKNN
jgi:hypothetical protein